MPAPDASTFLRPDLAESFAEFDTIASHAGFIGPMVLPVFDVALQTSNFSKIPVEQLLHTRKTERASGAGYARSDWTFTQDNYSCIEHGAEEVLDDRERNIFKYSLDFDRVSAARAMDAVLRNLEISIAGKIFNETTFTGSLTTAITNEWDDRANCTPVDDIFAALNSVRGTCGMDANTVIMGLEVWRNLLRSDQITDLLKHNGLDDVKNVTMRAMATLMQVDQILVGKGVKNTANEGAAASISDIWGNEHVFVGKLPVSNDLREPCLGRLFHFTSDGSTAGATIEQYREEKVRGDVLRARIDIDPKVIYVEAGHLLTNATT